jgi:hypothetical protein
MRTVPHNGWEKVRILRFSAAPAGILRRGRLLLVDGMQVALQETRNNSEAPDEFFAFPQTDQRILIRLEWGGAK